jgi:hypothetical protein
MGYVHLVVYQDGYHEISLFINIMFMGQFDAEISASLLFYFLFLDSLYRMGSQCLMLKNFIGKNSIST